MNSQENKAKIGLEELLELDYFKQDVTKNVTTLLSHYPDTRDSDERLVAIYYYMYYPKLVKEGRALDFVKAMAQGKIVSSDLITRTRRKLQEHNPELRGEKWKERQERQGNVRSDLKNIKAFKHSI